jgi:hypothetical protein
MMADQPVDAANHVPPPPLSPLLTVSRVTVGEPKPHAHGHSYITIIRQQHHETGICDLER